MRQIFSCVLLHPLCLNFDLAAQIVFTPAPATQLNISLLVMQIPPFAQQTGLSAHGPGISPS